MPLRPKYGSRLAGLRVEGDQVVAGRDRVDDAAALHLGVGDALAVVLAGRGLPARLLLHPPHPEGLAGGGVDGHDRAALAGHGVEPVADLDRRAPVDEVGLGPVVGRVPAPGDLELARVLGVDLVERRIAAAGLVPAPVAPLALVRPLVLSGAAARRRGPPGRVPSPGARRGGGRARSSLGPPLDADRLEVGGA